MLAFSDQILYLVHVVAMVSSIVYCRYQFDFHMSKILLFRLVWVGTQLLTYPASKISARLNHIRFHTWELV